MFGDEAADLSELEVLLVCPEAEGLDAEDLLTRKGTLDFERGRVSVVAPMYCTSESGYCAWWRLSTRYGSPFAMSGARSSARSRTRTKAAPKATKAASSMTPIPG